MRYDSGVLRRSRVCSLAAVVIAAAACGLPPGPSDSPSSSSGLHGEITDPAGDTQSASAGPAPPDCMPWMVNQSDSTAS